MLQSMLVEVVRNKPLQGSVLSSNVSMRQRQECPQDVRKAFHPSSANIDDPTEASRRVNEIDFCHPFSVQCGLDAMPSSLLPLVPRTGRRFNINGHMKYLEVAVPPH